MFKVTETAMNGFETHRHLHRVYVVQHNEGSLEKPVTISTPAADDPFWIDETLHTNLRDALLSAEKIVESEADTIHVRVISRIERY
jgi:hypothetical protein